METRHDFDSIVMALHGRVSAEEALEAIGRLRARIAALEAEKEARERQEPVAWAWNDPAGWMHIQETRERPEWISDEIADGMKLRPLYAHPLALREPTEDECSRIAIEAGYKLHTEAARIAIGRSMVRAVMEVMK